MIPLLIIDLEKILESDWLRAIQFLVNRVQKSGNIMKKRGNGMQMSQRMEHCDWLINKKNMYEPIRFRNRPLLTTLRLRMRLGRWWNCFGKEF